MLVVSKKKIPLLAILVLALAGAVVVMMPQVRSLIIARIEVAMGRALRKPEKWLGILATGSRVAIFFIFVVAFLNFTAFGEKIVARVKSVFCDFIAVIKTRHSAFAIAAIMLWCLFCFYRVLDADFLFADDVFRHVSGDRSWIGFSRYISEFLSMLFHTGRKISDIAPLAQIFAIVFMGFEIAMLSYILCGKISLPLMFALSLVFVNPLFSHCISYRYDAPYMTLAIVLPTIPFLFSARSERERLVSEKGGGEELGVFACVSFFCLVLCNMAYQAGASVYIVLAIFEVYRRFQKDNDAANVKKISLFMLTTILSFAAALLLFKFALMVPQKDEYFSAELNIAATGRNILIYLKSVFAMFGGKWTQVFLVAVFAVSFVVLKNQSEQKAAVSILLTVAAISLALLLSFGAYIVFDRPLFTPRAYMGFGFLVGLLAGYIFLYSKKLAARIPVFALLFGCVVFYYAYGNALRDQRIYQDFRTQILLADLNKFASNETKKNITFSGGLGQSKGFESAAKTFPIVREIIGALPGGGATWNDEILNFYNFNCDDPAFPADHGFPLLLSTNYHDIYGNGNDFYVVLK